jgi:hypothetical protein
VTQGAAQVGVSRISHGSTSGSNRRRPCRGPRPEESGRS